MIRKSAFSILLVFTLAFGVFSISASAPAQAQADGYSLEYSNFNGTCDSNGISFSASAQYDVATDAIVRYRDVINDVTKVQSNWGLSAGAGGYNTGFGVSGLGGAYGDTYTYKWKGVMYAAGVPVWEGLIVFQCDAGVASVTSATFGQVYGGIEGCEAIIPSGSVVGAFVDNAQIFGTPSADAGTDLVLEMGKTAWVTGMDSTGAYYQIIWSCDTVWVPVGTLGPNYDEVWNGTPLPTTVID